MNAENEDDFPQQKFD